MVEQASALPLILPASSPDAIRQAVRLLREGGVVAIPTDTVYGLIGLYDNEQAINRIYTIKGRPETKPLPVLMGTAAELPLIAAQPLPDHAWPLIYAFWPGALTIVLKSNSLLSSKITAGLGTVGVRVPNHTSTLQLFETLSFPVASTSANLTGQPPAQTADDIQTIFGPNVDLILSDVPTSSAGAASTVIDLTVSPYLVRRRGAIDVRALRTALATRVEVAAGA